MLFLKELTFFFALLNPFLLSLYLLEFFIRLDRSTFFAVLGRSFVMAGIIFSLFALTGDGLFTHLLQVRLASFQIFGGILFFIFGMKMFFEGTGAISAIRGEPEYLSGSVAMPFLIGPATVSASILLGSKLPLGQAFAVIWITLIAAVAGLFLLKALHDWLRESKRELIDRYIDITGRISALIIGTYAVEMIGNGLHSWLKI